MDGVRKEGQIARSMQLFQTAASIAMTTAAVDAHRLSPRHPHEATSLSRVARARTAPAGDPPAMGPAPAPAPAPPPPPATAAAAAAAALATPMKGEPEMTMPEDRAEDMGAAAAAAAWPVMGGETEGATMSGGHVARGLGDNSAEAAFEDDEITMEGGGCAVNDGGKGEAHPVRLSEFGAHSAEAAAEAKAEEDEAKADAEEEEAEPMPSASSSPPSTLMRLRVVIGDGWAEGTEDDVAEVDVAVVAAAAACACACAASTDAAVSDAMGSMKGLETRGVREAVTTCCACSSRR